jgi:hypothetical protein
MNNSNFMNICTIYRFVNVLFLVLVTLLNIVSNAIGF